MLLEIIFVNLLGMDCRVFCADVLLYLSLSSLLNRPYPSSMVYERLLGNSVHILLIGILVWRAFTVNLLMYVVMFWLYDKFFGVQPQLDCLGSDLGFKAVFNYWQA